MFTVLNIHHLRRLTQQAFTFHPRFNLISGPNGSGKTSVLESIYLLCTGHSFRTRESSPLIQANQASLSLYAETLQGKSIALQKSLADGTRVLIDSQVCSSSAVLARQYPCQVIYQDIFQIIDAGPYVRRNLLDWGMFHVKHSYHEVWTQYKKILKQRNALLKTNPSYASVLPWDAQLGACGEVLTQMRAAYIEDWRPCFYAVLDALGGLDCEMIFYKGWGRRQKELALSDLLKSSFEQDKLRQTTQQGPHQADILLNVEEIHTRYGLSRGQQKILVLALKLSQVLMLKKPCVVLLDDVAAELDEEHLSAVVKFLQSMDVQCFMSFIPMHRQVIEALFKNVDANFFQLQ